MKRKTRLPSLLYLIALLAGLQNYTLAASITIPHSIYAHPPKSERAPKALPAVSVTAGPGSTPSPEPSPSPSIAPLQISHMLNVQVLHRQTSGIGAYTAEVPAFISNGDPQPKTPFDLFSEAPLFPGTTLTGELRSTFRYMFKKSDIGLQTGVGFLDGSGYNAAYWGENTLPRLNTALGSTALPTTVQFPRHIGEDQTTATDAELLSGDFGTSDGKLRIKGGWFDLTQSDRFAFVQPPLTAIPPSIAIAPGETIAANFAGSDLWHPNADALPLHGLDLVAKKGLATFEIANTSLPALATNAVHSTIGSFVIDHGEGTRYSLDYSHTAIGGDPYSVGAAYGSQPQFQGNADGLSASSTLSGQRQTLFGLSASGHVYPHKSIDGLLEFGHSSYGADSNNLNQGHVPGNYIHAQLSTKHGRGTTFFDMMRMDAQYAPIILPYPSTANIWSAPYAANGVWYANVYSSVDNTQIGRNRKSLGLHYNLDGGPLELHAGVTDFRQIQAYTTSSGLQFGFNEPGFAPQTPGQERLGQAQLYALWLAWHPKFGDVSLDCVNDSVHQGSSADTVFTAYNVPQVVLTFSRHIKPDLVYSLGLANYSVFGRAPAPIDMTQNVFFGGVVVQHTPSQSTLLNLRHTETHGTNTNLSPAGALDFSENSATLEHRWKL